MCLKVQNDNFQVSGRFLIINHKTKTSKWLKKTQNHCQAITHCIYTNYNVNNQTLTQVSQLYVHVSFCLKVIRSWLNLSTGGHGHVIYVGVSAWSVWLLSRPTHVLGKCDFCWGIQQDWVSSWQGQKAVVALRLVEFGPSSVLAATTHHCECMFWHFSTSSTAFIYLLLPQTYTTAYNSPL